MTFLAPTGTDMGNTSNPPPKGHAGLKGPEDTPWGLSPSDFAFLWDDCPRCFYLKVARKQPRPSSPFPSVFGRIDRAMKEFYLGERAEVGLRDAGRGDRWGRPVGEVGTASLCPAVGQDLPHPGTIDVLVDCDDGTTGVVDFKTTIPKPDHIATYGRQLHAYAWPWSTRLEWAPRAGQLPGAALFPVPTPTRRPGGRPASTGTWSGSRSPGTTKPSPGFSCEVVGVLDGPDPPPASPNCSWCELREPQCVAA